MLEDTFDNDIGDVGETFDVTPEEASQQIDAFMAEVAADPQHPYLNAAAPGHRRALEDVSKLFRARAAGREDAQSTKFDKILQEAQEAQAAKQQQIRSAVADELEKLAALGFQDDSGSVPDDCPEYMIGDLKMQRLCAEQNFGKLEPMLRQQLGALRESPATMMMFSEFTKAAIEPSLKEEILEAVVNYVHRQHKAKYTPQRRQK